MANKEATEAETIPRGETQEANNFCRQLRLLFNVQIQILIGRTTHIKAKTVNTLPHPKATILSKDKSAANKINKTETASMVN